MQFDTKIAIVVRSDLAAWQKLNIAAFLSTGLIIENPELAGAPYEDADGTRYGRLIIQPMLIYAANGPGLARALERALSRGVTPAIYVEEMFKTMHDEANRQAVKSQTRAGHSLVGLAFRADRKVADKILDGLKLHD